MIQAAELALTNAGITQFVLSDPFDGSYVAGVAMAEMTDIPCDAYVVPHPQKPAIEIGISGRVGRAGASRGLEKFKIQVEQSDMNENDLPFGDALITRSGGGNSRMLINVLCLGSAYKDREIGAVQYAIISAMYAAGKSRADVMVFPTLCIKPTGLLSEAEVAETMMAGIYGFWKSHKGEKPGNAIIAVGNAKGTYDTFREVLERVFSSSNDGSSGRVRTVPPPMMEPEPRAIADALRDLRNLELTAFSFASIRKVPDLREACRDEPWFHKVAHLFTSDGGRQLSERVLKMLRYAMDSRIAD